MAWTQAARDAAAMTRKMHADKVDAAKAARSVIKGKTSPLSLLNHPAANRLVQLHTAKQAVKKSSYLDRIPKVKKFTPMSLPQSPREKARK
jgi:hypothetical protein